MTQKGGSTNEMQKLNLNFPSKRKLKLSPAEVSVGRLKVDHSKKGRPNGLVATQIILLD
jgi:hypothetical protein